MLLILQRLNMKLRLEFKLKNKAIGLYVNAQDVYNSAYKKKKQPWILLLETKSKINNINFEEKKLEKENIDKEQKSTAKHDQKLNV